MNFLRIILTRQIGKSVVLTDGNVMDVTGILDSGIEGTVNGVQQVIVSFGSVSELKEDEELNQMLQHNIKAGLIITTKPMYIKDGAVVETPMAAVEVNTVVEEEEEVKENVAVEVTRVQDLVQGDYVLLERNNDQLVLTFQSFTEDGDLICVDRGSETVHVPREKFISKVQLVS